MSITDLEEIDGRKVFVVKKILYEIYDKHGINEPDIVNRLKHTEDTYGVLIRLGETINGIPTMDKMFMKFVEDAERLNLFYGIYYVSRANTNHILNKESKWVTDKISEVFGNGLNNRLEYGFYWNLESEEVYRNNIWTTLRDIIIDMKTKLSSYKIGVCARGKYFEDYTDENDIKNYYIPTWLTKYDYYENDLVDGDPRAFLTLYGKIIPWN